MVRYVVVESFLTCAFFFSLGLFASDVFSVPAWVSLDGISEVGCRGWVWGERFRDWR